MDLFKCIDLTTVSDPFFHDLLLNTKKIGTQDLVLPEGVKITTLQ